MGLDEYNRKRDFTSTPEPDGAALATKRKGRALQYCIQKHDASRLHYDFRLELGGTLKSWAIPKGPSLDPGVRRLAVQVEDHPLVYAGFEGHIPEGHYGAGEVIVWDRGQWIPEGDPEEGYRRGKLKFTLVGEKLAGGWNLVRSGLQGRQPQWFLIKARDGLARDEADYDIVQARPDSVLSERTLTPRPRAAAARQARQEPAAGRAPKAPARRREQPAGEAALPKGTRTARLPETLQPQLATLVDSTPPGDWRYEIKFDGYRLLARLEAGRVQLFTRNGHDWTARLPEQAEALAKLGLESAWLDGEVVVPDADGHPDFQALQNAFEAQRSGNILYYLFDLPYLNGRDWREVPLEQRREALQRVLAGNDSPLLRFSEDFAEQPDALLDSACQMKLEGLIAKRAGSHYESRRSTSWLKLKCSHRQEFVIVGYTEPKGRRTGFGALLLGLHDEAGRLLYAGRVGTGFSRSTLQSLHERMQPLAVSSPSLDRLPATAEVRDARWLKPVLVAEVAYAEMTRQGVVRHAVFHGLRGDKPASAITREQPRPTAQASAADALLATVRITHPQRLIDRRSKATKQDVARYYAEIAPWMLPQLQRRPLALLRAPEGLQGTSFFQKHADGLSIPHLGQLSGEDGAVLLAIESPEALVEAAQMGMLELHAWNAVAPDLQHPDRFVLDLDPDPALPWRRMIEATRLTLTLLEELGLQAYLKTSGGKGMHVLVPLAGEQGWDEVKAFSKAIAGHMAKLIPSQFTALSGPRNRVGKIFIDYLRNSQGASTVAAYSLRAREGLPVSVPVFLDELDNLKAASQWHLGNLQQRLAELGDDDPWMGIGSCRQVITTDMRERLARGR